MNQNFRIGRIAGIQVSVNWSWVIVFTLIVNRSGFHAGCLV